MLRRNRDGKTDLASQNITSEGPLDFGLWIRLRWALGRPLRLVVVALALLGVFALWRFVT